MHEYLTVAVRVALTPHMASTVHVDICKKDWLAIPNIFFSLFFFPSDHTVAVLQLKNKQKETITSTLPSY